MIEKRRIMNENLEKYIQAKDIRADVTPDCYELSWKDRSLFHDFTNGWRAEEGEDGRKVVLGFVIQEIVDTRRFTAVFDSMPVRYEVSLSFTDECQGRGCPCFSAEIDEPGEEDFRTSADAVAVLITEVACVAWKDYLGSCSESEVLSFNAHYGDGQRLVFIDRNIVRISTMAMMMRAVRESPELLEDLDLAIGHLPCSSPDKVFQDEGCDALEEECHNRWVEPDGTRTGGFRNVAGMDALKKKVGDSVIWPLTHREQAGRYRVSMPGGMVLYGPPGCGKTYFAEMFAQECGLPYLLVSPSDLGSPFVHGSQHLISCLFEEAEKRAPCVVCLDEIDAMIPARQNGNYSQMNGEVNEFLSHLNNCGKRGVFVIGTTNMKDLIDPAALRKGRLDYQVEIPAPDLAQRGAMFEHELKDRPVFIDVDVSVLAAATEGYSCSDISYVVNEAALAAAIRQQDISQGMLEEQIRRTVPSLRNSCVRKAGFAPAATPQEKQIINLAY